MKNIFSCTYTSNDFGEFTFCSCGQVPDTDKAKCDTSNVLATIRWHKDDSEKGQHEQQYVFQCVHFCVAIIC